MSLWLNINNFPTKIKKDIQFQETSNPGKLREKESQGVKLEAESGIVVDLKTNHILFGKNIEEKRAIASISKLMSALVFLDHNPGWDKEIKIIKADYRTGGVHIFEGEIIKVKDLFYNSLVISSNSATIALARSTGMSIDQFVEEMNKKAKDLGMVNTSFQEPTGLSANNISTALDLSLLTSTSFQNEEIQKALKTDSYTFSPVNKKEARTIGNTDKLLNSFLDEGEYKIIGAKTGFTNEAKYCFTLGVEDKSQNNGVISIVLGTDQPDDRFQEAKSLAWWGINKIKK